MLQVDLNKEISKSPCSHSDYQLTLDVWWSSNEQIYHAEVNKQHVDHIWSTIHYLTVVPICPPSCHTTKVYKNHHLNLESSRHPLVKSVSKLEKDHINKKKIVLMIKNWWGSRRDVMWSIHIISKLMWGERRLFVPIGHTRHCSPFTTR